jgi:hypothetical protein
MPTHTAPLIRDAISVYKASVCRPPTMTIRDTLLTQQRHLGIGDNGKATKDKSSTLEGMSRYLLHV